MKKSILISLLTILILSACGGAPDVPTPDPTEALKTVAGQYFVQITADDLQRSGLTNPALQDALGLWEFTFTEEGRITGTRNGAYAGDARFGFNGHEMNSIVERCEDCGCEGSISRFSWAADETQLVLKTTYDGCEAMNFILTSKPLLRR
jgi:hypothetical protein